MNLRCAHCTGIIDRHRINEILCAKCEKIWWEAVKEIYYQWLSKIEND